MLLLKIIFLCLLVTIGANGLHLESVLRNELVTKICSQSAAWTLVPHQQHCRKFYVCTEENTGRYDEYSCPRDYHFSSKFMRCSPGACNEPESLAAACPKTGLERVRDDCRRYRHCTTHGAYALLSCGMDNYFDAGLQSCLPIAVTANHQCSCLLPDHSTLSNPSDCETYFICENGQAVLHQCPRDYYYNSTIGSCLLDTTGVCLEHPTKPPTSFAELEALAQSDCSRTGSLLVPHSTDCSQYFICVGNRVINMNCPNRQYFDVLKRYCVWDVRGQCTKTANNKVHQYKRPLPPTKKLSHKTEAVEVDVNLTDMHPSKEQHAAADYDGNYNKLSSKFLSF